MLFKKKKIFFLLEDKIKNKVRIISKLPGKKTTHLNQKTEKVKQLLFSEEQVTNMLLKAAPFHSSCFSSWF